MKWDNNGASDRQSSSDFNRLILSYVDKTAAELHPSSEALWARVLTLITKALSLEAREISIYRLKLRSRLKAPSGHRQFGNSEGIMARWVTAKTLKNGWQQFWKDSRQIPDPVWRKWAGTLAIGLGLCAIITFAMTIAAKSHVDQGLQAWDARLLPILAERIPLSFPRAITWESPGNSLGMLPIVAVFIGIMVARSRPLLTATMVAAYVLQFALVWIGWGYWNRDRPDLIANGVAASGLHSFPSGHIVVVITVYGLLGYLWCRASRSWTERLVITLAIAFWITMIVLSRLVLGAHWPSDVIVGIIMGILWLATVIVALRRVDDAI